MLKYSSSVASALCRRAPLTACGLVVAFLTTLAADVLLAAQPAMAQQGFGNFFTYQSPKPRRVAKKKRATPQEETQQATKTPTDPATKKAAEKSGPAQPVYVIVSLKDQHASIYDANGFVTRTRVSTGQAGHRTPSGVFSVIGKKRFHRSNIYSGAPMPWMQRITWSGVAMHAGVVPGYPASHGCIRLPAGFAPQLYKMTEMGARVVVSPTDVRPVEFSHPFLPTPKMHEPPAIPASPAQQAANGTAVELASMDTAAVGSSTAPAAPQLLNPIAYAKALKQRALADKAAADLTAKNALAAAQAAGAEARQSQEDVRKAEAALQSAQARLAALEAPAAKAATLQPAAAGATTENTEAVKVEAEAAVKQAEAVLAEVRAHETARSSAAFAAVETYKRATAEAEAADQLVDEADRRREQVSVLISRKEGRIFIRQNWKEVWEAPVTIRDPDRPLGTHVYSAIEPAADGSSMRWISISMPEAVAGADTAAGALDRIELPEGARERIAELLWTGGSLIVSDQPRSPEMSEDATDFIVLTR